MTQRVFVKVVGFTDVERHALNSLFRLSEERETKYALWDAAAPGAPKLALVDGQSFEARLELAAPSNSGIKLIWVGAVAPVEAWRTYERPLSWPEVVRSMDELFAPAADLDFDLDSGSGASEPNMDAVDTRPPDDADVPRRKRALIASPSREERLYLRARLALANLTLADDAETGAQALELARDNEYVLAVVDFALADVEGWALLKEMDTLKHRIPCMVAIKSKVTLVDYVRARIDGVNNFFARPLHPAKLHRLFTSI